MASERTAEEESQCLNLSKIIKRRYTTWTTTQKVGTVLGASALVNGLAGLAGWGIYQSIENMPAAIAIPGLIFGVTVACTMQPISNAFCGIPNPQNAKPAEMPTAPPIAGIKAGESTPLIDHAEEEEETKSSNPNYTT